MKSQTKKQISPSILSQKISDQLWQVIQFWGIFAKETIGKHLLFAADQLSNSIDLNKKSPLQKGKDQRPEDSITMQHLLETHAWLDKARRRRLIDKQAYQLIYKNLKQLETLLEK